MAGERRLGIDEARGKLSSVVDEAGQGRLTWIGRESHGAVIVPLTWLDGGYERLLPALATVPLTAARPKLGKLVEAAAAGAPQVLTRNGEPVAVLVAEAAATLPPAVSGRDRRTPGRAVAAKDVLAAPAGEGVSFGLPSLAVAGQALTPGRLGVIAARQGAGGSLLAIAAARATALGEGRTVLYVASGLTRRDVAWRLVAAEAGVDYQRLRAATLPPDQLAAAQAVSARLGHPLYIDDTAGMRAEEIAETAGDMEDLALVVVDRLQARPAAHLPLSGQALPQAARVLSELAARLAVPVLAVVDTDDPQVVAALDADVTLTLSLPGDGGVADVLVAERDFGPLTSVRLRADLARARFTEADPTVLPAQPTDPVTPVPAAVPTPVRTPEAATEASADGERRAPAARTAAVASSRVRRGESAPCQDCGAATPYRIDGRPAHMPGFCRPQDQQPPAQPPTQASAPAPAPAAAAPASVPAPAEAEQPADTPEPASGPEPVSMVQRVGEWPAGASRPQPVAADEPPTHEPAVGVETADDPDEDVPGRDLEEEDSERGPRDLDWGPFVVLDGGGTAYLADGGTLRCPATSVRELAEWVTRQPVGTPRLSRFGRDGDPLVVLMPEAAEKLGLPASDDDETRALPVGHPVLADLAAGGWEVPRRGERPWFSAWARVFQRQSKGRRSVLIAVTCWGALSPTFGWPLPVDPDTGRPSFTVAEAVTFLTAYSRRVATPLSSTAVTGLELMTALRPPTRAWREEKGKVRPAWVPDALHLPVDPAPCEAPPGHPLTVGRNHTDPAQTLMEEALQWWRMPTDGERRLPFIVALDINAAFGAATNKLQVGTCAPYHLHQVPFDKKLPGSWLYDLSGVQIPEGMPSPFTPTGEHPTGPAWYETHTIAYAVERGFRPPPAAQAWVRPNAEQARRLGVAPHPAPVLDEQQRRRLPKEPAPPFGNVPYLTPWYEHLRDAYMDTYEALGIAEGMPAPEFLAKMEQLSDPAFREENATELQVLSAIKTTFKGAIGKLRERDHRTGRRLAGSRWPALERPTWRPDIRAAIIARSRVNMHRKIVATAAATGAVPLAVRTDCLLYASDSPDILWLTGHTSGFQLGCNPGFVKPEPFYFDQAFHSSQSMDWYLHWAGQGKNPAGQMKDKSMPRDSAAALDGGE